MRNICEKCKTENPLGANLCNVCNSTIKPINDNEQLIESFIHMTNSSREIAIQFLGISNSINDAISLYFESNNISEVVIQQNVSSTDMINNLASELSDRFNMPSNIIQNIVTTITSGSISDRNELFNMLGNNSQYDSFQYPNNDKDFKIQILFGWGKNEPHYCRYCLSKAFFNFIKIKNTETSNLINMVPERIFTNQKINNNICERLEYLKTNLEGIDNMLDNICNRLSDTFNTIYEIYEKLSTTDDHNDEIFLDTVQERIGNNFRIIWETIHQNDLKQKFSKEQINKKLLDLVNTSTFIQFITNIWHTETHNHPVSDNVLEKLRYEKIDSEEKLKELNLEKESCAICLEEFKNDNSEITMLDCHTFHKNCVLKWFETNNTCPICRKKIDSKLKQE